MPIKSDAFWIILPAAGLGQRFNQTLPKQYTRIFNKTVLEHTIDLFLPQSWVEGIVVALSEEDQQFVTLPYDSTPKIKTVQGGASRAQSVENALHYLKSKAKGSDWVLVHDAVRPCLHEADLHHLLETLMTDEVGGILCSAVQDSLKWVENHTIKQTLSREQCWRALTPQMFRLDILLQALIHCRQQGIQVTDESQALEELGYHPKIVPAAYPNPKLTLASDKAYIELLLHFKKAREEVC